jgi:hypothetical protein
MIRGHEPCNPMLCSLNFYGHTHQVIVVDLFYIFPTVIDKGIDNRARQLSTPKAR